jgi:hypothetical protein
MHDFSEGVIRAAKLYSSRDKQLIVDTFDIGGSAPCNLDGPDLREKYLLTLSLAEKRHEERGGDAWPATDLLHYFAGLTEDYVRTCSPARIMRHADLCRQLRLKTSRWCCSKTPADARLSSPAPTSPRPASSVRRQPPEHALHRHHARLRRHHVRRRRGPW